MSSSTARPSKDLATSRQVIIGSGCGAGGRETPWVSMAVKHRSLGLVVGRRGVARARRPLRWGGALLGPGMVRFVRRMSSGRGSRRGTLRVAGLASDLRIDQPFNLAVVGGDADVEDGHLELAVRVEGGGVGGGLGVGGFVCAADGSDGDGFPEPPVPVLTFHPRVRCLGIWPWSSCIMTSASPFSNLPGSGMRFSVLGWPLPLSKARKDGAMLLYVS